MFCFTYIYIIYLDSCTAKVFKDFACVVVSISHLCFFRLLCCICPEKGIHRCLISPNLFPIAFIMTFTVQCINYIIFILPVGSLTIRFFVRVGGMNKNIIVVCYKRVRENKLNEYS